MKILYLFAVIALFTLSYAEQEVPLQKGGYGFSVGDQYGTLHIEFVLDFQCTDSKDAFNVWTAVRKSISLSQNNVKLTYQFNPLPYHFYSTKIHQAFFYVLKARGPSAAEEFISYVFAKQDDLTEEAYINKTGSQFDQDFSLMISRTFGLDAAAVEKQLALGSQSFNSLRYHWKYATITKGVAGAPLFFANGVLIDGAESFSYSDWISFIQKYRQ